MSGACVDAVVLAAGASARMAPDHKLLAVGADGRALIAHGISALRAAGLRRVLVVVGFQAEAVAAAIGDPGVERVHCADFASGQSHSLRAGLRALSSPGDAVLVCLGDMPLVSTATITGLIRAWRPGAIVVPAWQGHRGNPVLWDRSLVPAMLQTTGDQGARWLLAREADRVVVVPTGDDAVLRDADTPAALRALPGGPWRTQDGRLI